LRSFIDRKHRTIEWNTGQDGNDYCVKAPAPGPEFHYGDYFRSTGDVQRQALARGGPTGSPPGCGSDESGVAAAFADSSERVWCHKDLYLVGDFVHYRPPAACERLVSVVHLYLPRETKPP